MDQQSLGGPDVGTAADRAPRFSAPPWPEVVRRDDAWWVLAPSPRAELSQAQLVTAGAAVQQVLVAVEATGQRLTVRTLPAEAPDAVAVLEPHGPGPAHRADELLHAVAGDQPPHLMTPSDLRHLNLTAEALGCELLWQDDAASPPQLEHAQRLHARGTGRSLTTVVTPGDGPEDWLTAGRVIAQCLLVAADLGFATDLGPHALAHRATREQVRDLWDLPGWPQAQMTLHTRDLSSEF